MGQQRVENILRKKNLLAWMFATDRSPVKTIVSIIRQDQIDEKQTVEKDLQQTRIVWEEVTAAIDMSLDCDPMYPLGYGLNRGSRYNKLFN